MTKDRKTLEMLKNQLRCRVYQQRNAQIDKNSVSRRICERIVDDPLYRQATTVLWYSHCRSEVRTQERLRRELTGDKCIVVPYCTKDDQGNNKLGLWHLQNFAELTPGMWGILEPPKQRWGEPEKEIAPKQLDYIVIPGVAFDRNGGRLGNGAGYYDRLLQGVRKDAVLAGICYECQLVEQVVTDTHDIAMDLVITEQAVYSGRGIGN